MAEIPIQNVYYLLCYAWRQMREGEIAAAGTTGRTELANLFGQVLANGTRRVLHQGLDRGYVTRGEDAARIRGRIDFSTSLKRALLSRARIHCTYDELSRNVLHNRILRSTLRRLNEVEGLDGDLRSDLKQLERHFWDVDVIPMNGRVFRRVQLHGGNAFYRFLMNVCELVQENVFVTEAGSRRFRDFRRDDATMWKLFEDFVFNFYDHEQRIYDVSSPQIPWDLQPPEERAARLPTMNTDVVLRSDRHTIILDTKFYSETLQSHHNRQSYHSNNLYQLFSYLKNAEALGGGYEDAEGLLLYPTVSVDIDEAFVVQGHRLRVVTLDLAQSWQGIRKDLLALVDLRAGADAPVPAEA